MAEDLEVEIFGQAFRVAAGEATSGYIQRLAAYVDEKMRALASTTKTMPMNRIAILTALNIADDLFKLHDAYEAKTEHLLALVQEHLENL